MENNDTLSIEEAALKKAQEAALKTKESEDRENSASNSTEKKKESYGKFGSLSSLLKAYKSLESEFTKKCKLLKEAQNSIDELQKTIQNMTQEHSDYLQSEEFVCEIMQNEEITGLIIKNYLNSLNNRHKPPLLSTQTGYTFLMPVNKPQSIQEAGKLASILIKNR